MSEGSVVVVDFKPYWQNKENSVWLELTTWADFACKNSRKHFEPSANRAVATQSMSFLVLLGRNSPLCQNLDCIVMRVICWGHAWPLHFKSFPGKWSYFMNVLNLLNTHEIHKLFFVVTLCCINSITLKAVKAAWEGFLSLESQEVSQGNPLDFFVCFLKGYKSLSFSFKPLILSFKGQILKAFKSKL